MAQLFLSYHREDAGEAQAIATALEKAGHGVWWDRHIKGGSRFSKEIEKALKEADAVIVLWSERSVESDWVRDEAGAGRDKGRLVPLSIRGTLPPLGFRQFQSIDLDDWQGRGRVPRLKEILAAIDRQLKEPGIPAPEMAPVRRRYEGLSVSTWVLIALGIGMFFVVIGLLIGRPWEGRKSSPATVAIAAADTSPASKALARDILAQLGQLQSARPDALQLVSVDAGKSATLLLEVAAAAEGSQSRGNLVLLDRKTKALLWSKSFERPAGEAGDLRQQLGYTAAQVLQCAAEARPDGRAALRSKSLKLYLNSCAAFADKTPDNLQSLVSQFRQLTKEEPKFADGWAKLLLVESYYTHMAYVPEATAILRSLPAHIAAASAVDPDMPEAFLAEAMSQPDRAFERRMELLQKARDSDPDNAAVLSIHSDQLRFVGRINESIQAAQRAVQADPLSPTVRNSLVDALNYGGKLDAALSELKRMEQTWPGASNVIDARFSVNLRYGDPKQALDSIQSGEISAVPPYVESFLRARIDPSPANIDRTVEDARSWYEEAPTSIYHLVQVLGTFGREEQLFSILLAWPHPDKVTYVVDGLFRPALGNFHRDPRMMAVSKRLGLLDYWQRTGNWPDFCFEPELPYDCKAEAAKLG